MLTRLVLALLLLAAGILGLSNTAAAQTPAQTKLTDAKKDAAAKKLTAEADVKTVADLEKQLDEARKAAAKSKAAHTEAEATVIIAEGELDLETLKALKTEYAELLPRIRVVNSKYIDRKKASDAAPKEQDKVDLTAQAKAALDKLMEKKASLEKEILKLDSTFTPTTISLQTTDVPPVAKAVPKMEPPAKKTKYEIKPEPYPGATVRNEDGTAVQTELSYTCGAYGEKLNVKYGDRTTTASYSKHEGVILDNFYLPAALVANIDYVDREWRSDGEKPDGWYPRTRLDRSKAPEKTPERFTSIPTPAPSSSYVVMSGGSVIMSDCVACGVPVQTTHTPLMTTQTIRPHSGYVLPATTTSSHQRITFGGVQRAPQKVCPGNGQACYWQ